MSHPIQIAPCRTFHPTKHTQESKYARHSRLGDWDYVVHIKSDRAGAAQYLIFNLLGLFQTYYFYIGFPTQLLMPLQPRRWMKQRDPRGLELQRIQRNQDVDKIHTTSSWGNLVNSCSDTLLFPQSYCHQLSHQLISSVWSGLFKKEGGGLGGLHFNPFSYKTVVR